MKQTTDTNGRPFPFLPSKKWWNNYWNPSSRVPGELTLRILGLRDIQKAAVMANFGVRSIQTNEKNWEGEIVK